MSRIIQGPWPTRIARMTVIRADYTAGRVDRDHSIRKLRQVYPSLTLTDDGWLRLLTED